MEKRFCRAYFVREYEKAAAFAHGYNAQQMLDRDNGRLEMAAWCQAQARNYASYADEYRNLIQERDAE